jgi:hypothetical protein
VQRQPHLAGRAERAEHCSTASPTNRPLDQPLILGFGARSLRQTPKESGPASNELRGGGSVLADRSGRFRAIRKNPRSAVPLGKIWLDIGGGGIYTSSMNSTDWIVIAAGIAVIGWVNWYFFVASRRGK